MCIMGNGNDSPACIPSWKFPDEKHEFNEQWFMYINKMVGAYYYIVIMLLEKLKMILKYWGMYM